MGPFDNNDEPSSLEVCVDSLEYQEREFGLDTGQKMTFDLDTGQHSKLDPDTGQHMTFDPDTGQHMSYDQHTGQNKHNIFHRSMSKVKRQKCEKNEEQILGRQVFSITKCVKSSKNAQNRIKVQKEEAKSEKGSCLRKDSEVKDNKLQTLNEEKMKDLSKNRRGSSKAEIILGERQDGRIAKESQMLSVMEERSKVRDSKGHESKVRSDKGQTSQERKRKEMTTAENRKIEQELTGEKPETDKMGDMSMKSYITSLKEVQRAPAEHEDHTISLDNRGCEENSMTVTEEGGEENSMDTEVEQKSSLRVSLCESDAKPENQEKEGIRKEEKKDEEKKDEEKRDEEKEDKEKQEGLSKREEAEEKEKLPSLVIKNYDKCRGDEELLHQLLTNYFGVNKQMKQVFGDMTGRPKDIQNMILKELSPLIIPVVIPYLPFHQVCPCLLEPVPLTKESLALEVKENESEKEKNMMDDEEKKYGKMGNDLGRFGNEDFGEDAMVLEGSESQMEINEMKKKLMESDAELKKFQCILKSTEDTLKRAQSKLSEFEAGTQSYLQENDVDDVNPGKTTLPVSKQWKFQEANSLGKVNVHVPTQGQGNDPYRPIPQKRNLSMYSNKSYSLFPDERDVGRGDNSCMTSPKDSNSGDKEYRSRRRYDKDASEKENRNQDDEKEKDEQEDTSFNNSQITMGAEQMPGYLDNENAVFKFRRKETHGKLGETDLMEFLGQLSEIDQDIPPDLLENMEGVFEEVDQCLIFCLRKQGTEKELEECSICLYLGSLIQHFGKCATEYRAQVSLVCTMCLQLFRLVQLHVQQCAESKDECPILMCRKISYLVAPDKMMIFTKAAKIWKKLKKHMLSYVSVPVEIMETEEEEYFSMTPLVSVMQGINVNVPPLRSSLRLSTVFNPNLPFIPEDKSDLSLNVQKTQRPEIPKPISKSEPIARKRPDGRVDILVGPSSASVVPPRHLPLRDLPDGKPLLPGRVISPSGGRLGVVGPPDGEFSVLSPSGSQRQEKPLSKPPLKVTFSNEPPSKEKLHRKTSGPPSLPSPRLPSIPGGFTIRDVDLDAHPEQVSSAQPTEHEDNEPLQPTSISDYSETSSLGDKRTYGVGEHIQSMPMNTAPWRNDQPLLSLEDRPTGFPGIGEVVYGQRDILRMVIQYWTALKLEYKEYGRLLVKQVREEGVIFPDCKKKLLIMKSRYQKNFQWIRLTHLGRGMSGNCHLASDYNSDYQFCIKKIHISKYQEEELLIWSDLDHPSIVRLHGALRRKEKIYIISEFIGGGSLTETINNQKRMTRRLSHWMALNYFRQILQVLKYLQKKNVIHEDLKADNILLRSDTHKIAIADFGVATRIHGNTVPPGMTTKGTPTQFSPEKAMSAGHSYKADLWSAVCVMVHMLSGDPPWVKRFPNAKMLFFLIVEKDPPLEDVPKNVSIDVLDLIEQGFQKDPKMRPSAQELLHHRAFGLLESNPDTFTSTLLTSIHQLPDTQLPVNTPIQQEQHAMVEQIEKDLRQPPGGATGKVFTSYESVTGKKDLTALSNVDVRDAPDKPKIHVGKAQPEFTSMEGKQTTEADVLKFSSLQGPSPLTQHKMNEKSLMSVRDRTGLALRSIDDSRIDSMRKAMTAKASEFMQDKTQMEELLNNYMNDDNNEIDVYTVTATGYSYPKLPTYATSESDKGSSTGGAVGGENSEEKDQFPAFEVLLNEGDPEEYIDRLHDLALVSQMSRTSASSRSDEGFKRSMSRSSSQMYSDADRDLDKLLQDTVIGTLAEEEHENNHVFDNQNRSNNSHSLDDSSTQNASRSAVSSEDVEIRSEITNAVRNSGGEASPSVNLPFLTPFEKSDEKTPEAGPGNLPCFLDDYENSSTLSGKTGNFKSSDLPRADSSQQKIVDNGSVEERNSVKVRDSRPDEKKEQNDTKDGKTLTTSGEGRLRSNTTPNHGQGHPDRLHLREGLGHLGHNRKLLVDSGPKTLPIRLPSDKPDPRMPSSLVTQSPMSMFQEEEPCISDELFASGPNSPNMSLQATSPASYVPEITMAEHSPVGSSSSEMSFTKVQKFPDKKFEAFKLEEERPFMGEPSIHIAEDDEATQVVGVTGPSTKDTQGPDLGLGQSNSSSQRRQSNRHLTPLDFSKSPNDKKKYRLSTPSFTVASPVTPQKFSTPQVGYKYSPLIGVKKEGTVSSGWTVGTPVSERQLKFPTPHSTSPRSFSQIDENDMKIREFMEQMSQHSNDSFIIHKDIDDPGVDISIYSEDNYEESLSYTINQYIQQDEGEGNGKGLKVKIEVPNTESMEYRLTAEYYRTNWQQIIERDFSSGIHNKGMPVFTLYKGETPLDLHNSPSDSGSTGTLHLTAKDVRRDRTQQQWYCEGGMCMNAAGIPL